MFIHERVLLVKSRSCVSLAGIKSLLSLNTAARINKRKKSFLKQSKLPLKRVEMSALDRFLNSEFFIKKDTKQLRKSGIKSIVGKFETKENELKLDVVKATTSLSWLWVFGIK